MPLFILKHVNATKFLNIFFCSLSIDTIKEKTPQSDSKFLRSKNKDFASNLIIIRKFLRAQWLIGLSSHKICFSLWPLFSHISLSKWLCLLSGILKVFYFIVCHSDVLVYLRHFCCTLVKFSNLHLHYNFQGYLVRNVLVFASATSSTILQKTIVHHRKQHVSMVIQ